MVDGAGAHVRRVLGGAVLLACLVGGAAPAVADTPPGATLTFVPPNETKILTISPAPTTTTTATTVPAPIRTAPRTAAPVAAPTATTVAPDSPALRALVEASTAERRRLGDAIAELEARIGGMDAALAVAQDGLSSQRAGIEALEVRAGRARSEVDQADARVGRLQASASTAADAAGAPRTPVARPPALGHTPQDAAAQARQALADAVGARLDAGDALAVAQLDLDLAREAAVGASAGVEAGADELQRARDALAGLRQQLAAAEQAAPIVPAAGQVTLVPGASALGTATVPAAYLSLYGRAAATCAGLPWTVLAAVGAVESGHGQSTAPGVQTGANVAGAMGPMQFLAATWAAYGVDGDGDGIRNVYDPDDAVFGAARYLCASGAGTPSTLRSALFSYNHADWYVEMVLALAARL
jgi:membrane-bound lytic murein transglycosylase B